MKNIIFALVLILQGTTALAANEDNQVVRIPAGEFFMGTDDSYSNAEGVSETDGAQPAHKVFLDSYEIDRYEVTVLKYMKCVSMKKCRAIPKEYLKFYGSNEPIRMVSWYDAQSYCLWAGMRLPTEAEWERAARGSSNSANPWGNRGVKNEVDSAIGGSFGNVGNHPLDKSDFGVYDMAGNVSEWVSDWFSFDYKHAQSKNPQGPQAGETNQYLTKPMRTVRGRNFQTNIKGNFQESYFSISRYGVEPSIGTPTIGFRCAR